MTTTPTAANHLSGRVGLGFRVTLAEQILTRSETPIEFLEVAPENYVGVGGKRGRLLAMARERFAVVSHGICGDFAGAAPVDDDVLGAVAAFLRESGARWYSDHLCFTHIAGAESHDLVPMPMTDEAAARAAARIRLVQDRLGLPVAIENVSAYVRHVDDAYAEADFVRRVAVEADCKVLLDVNNVYVNAVNFPEGAPGGRDFPGAGSADVMMRARAAIDAMPLERVVQMHMAGHTVEEVDADGVPVVVVDTHGEDIIDPVFDLFAYTVAAFARRGLAIPPTLLERDHNIPALPTLEAEIAKLQAIVRAAGGAR